LSFKSKKSISFQLSLQVIKFAHKEFCLSDFYIIQKWIDYAKGIGDQSIKVFEDRPIIYQDIYDKAKERTVS